jgi:hypothetical protein
MKTHEFTVILRRKPAAARAERLYGICQDGTLAVSAGVGQVHFHRAAKSLEDALRSALADLDAAGLAAKRIEMETSVLLTN